MRIPRFIIASRSMHDYAPGDTLAIIGTDLHHLRNVLRLKKGDLIEVSDSDVGSLFLCKLTSVTSCQASAEITAQLSAPLRKNRLTLVMGIPEPKVCDFITEKCVELGVEKIYFFQAVRSQGKLHKGVMQNRLPRLERIAKAALKQSGAGCLPLLQLHQSLHHALQSLHIRTLEHVNSSQVCDVNIKDSAGLRLVFVPTNHNEGTYNEASISPPSILEIIKLNQLLTLSKHKFQKEPLQLFNQNADSFLLLGPEGGLVPEEIKQAKIFGYQAASLGPRILRAETAALVACAIVCMQ